jgi:hypothetical protein
MRRLLSLLTGFALVLTAPSRAIAADHSQSQPNGVRVLTAGHSFHVWMPPVLKEIAANARIDAHQQVDLQSIGGSRVIQHWELPAEKNKIKPALIAGKADVLTLSPIYLPDEGIEKFVRLGLEHNPALRVTVQEFWLPFDDQALWSTRAKGVTIDPDKKTIDELRRAHASYFESMDEHVRALNQQLGKTVVFVVPVGQAVLALRKKIINGEAPGIAKQSELFRDPLGHPNAQIKALAGYCHFAVIYRRDPRGLPILTDLSTLPEGEKLNAMLQRLAWDAVTSHPLSGVSAGSASESPTQTRVKR